MYYIAKIEGPLTWEQLRHWYESGFLEDFSKLLVCSAPTAGAAPGSEAAPFRLMSDAFPDPTLAFIPDEVLHKKRGASVASTIAQFNSSTDANGSTNSNGRSKTNTASSLLNDMADDEQKVGDSVDVEAAMLDPLECKAHAAAMEAFFTAHGNQWYFIDTEGTHQGPFSAESMSKWFEAGYFWDCQLPIKHDGWKEFAPLKDLLARATKPVISHDPPQIQGSLSSASSANIVKPSEIKSEPLTSAATVMPPKRKAPEVASAMKASRHVELEPNGMITTNVEVRAAIVSDVVNDINLNSREVEVLEAPSPKLNTITSVQEQQVDSTPATTQHTAPETVSEAASSAGTPSDADMWQYIDEAGNVQGPFPSSSMAEWVAWGYFSDDVRVRNVSAMPEKTFLPLGVLFPDPGPDATDEQLAATAPFESDCWVNVWKAHNK